ncbi:MAG: HIT family protein [Burkholderiaceae bacterium]|nr:HIT family protein [Burkholderiaceae bacterium]
MTKDQLTQAQQHAPADCLFCRIGAKSVPSHVVHESDRILAFLDIHPIRRGHVVIIPKAHHAYFDDLPGDLAAEILGLARELAPILRRRYDAKRVGFMFTGTDIAHAHAHVVPMVEPTDLTSRRYIAEEQLSFGPAPRMSDKELGAVAREISTALVAEDRFP